MSPGPRTKEAKLQSTLWKLSPLPGPAAHMCLPGPGLWLLALMGVLCDGGG